VPDLRKRILIVDDDQTICAVLQVLLQGDYAVETEQDGARSVLKAVASPPDLIICDMRMPGLSGHEVLAKLRAAEPTTHVPVLLITGEAESEAGSWTPANAVTMLRKPFRAPELRARIVTLLNDASANGAGALQAA
jgi:CheY-like chemotaxis protein